LCRRRFNPSHRHLVYARVSGVRLNKPGSRRFPPPWTAEETDACFIVCDANGFAVAHTHFEDEPGRRTHARQPSFSGRGFSGFGSLGGHFLLGGPPRPLLSDGRDCGDLLETF
jgi:hypothetical protein